jgi:hypothetical protein
MSNITDDVNILSPEEQTGDHMSIQMRQAHSINKKDIPKREFHRNPM